MPLYCVQAGLLLGKHTGTGKLTGAGLLHRLGFYGHVQIAHLQDRLELFPKGLPEALLA